MSKSQSKSDQKVERTKIKLRYEGKFLSTDTASALIDNLRQRFNGRDIFVIELIDGEITIPTSEVDILVDQADRYYGHRLIRL